MFRNSLVDPAKNAYKIVAAGKTEEVISILTDKSSGCSLQLTAAH